MPTIPIRSDNAYFGFSKQISQGTAVAPSLFPRWLDGSSLSYELSASDIYEGDGTRRLSQVIKNKQMVKIKIVFDPRPIELGFFEAAALGVGSDVITSPTVNTTLSGSSIAGATSISVVANAGLLGTGSITLVLEPGTATEEVATFTVPATGPGPYALTVSTGYNGGALKLAHTSAGIVRSATSHIMTDQVDGPYLTCEVGLGSLNGGAGPTLRVRDCKIEQIKRSSKAGDLLAFEIDLSGIATTFQSTPATVSYEMHNPFFYTSGVWTVNGSAGGDALAIEMFDITQKNNLDDTIQTEQLTLAAIIYGNVNVDVAFDYVMQNSQFLQLIYAGSPTGTTDAQQIGSGSLSVVFAQPDGFHSVAYNLLTVHYTKGPPPAPKKDGKHYKVSVSGSSVSNQSANPCVIQSTIQNAQTTAY